MNSCSFSSVCDAYDGGIVPSINNPLASLTASNTSFIGCCRTRNVECTGTAEVPLKPDRQNTTDNGQNTFTWCEWSGSRTTGESDSWTDGVSSGGAICMYNQSSATVSVSHCAFNECVAHWCGGGINCYNIKSVEIVNNKFNACTAQGHRGGGILIYTISTCVRISGCEFQNCKANNGGGGLLLENFQVSEGCIQTENGEGESACVFDCRFTSCSVTNYYGGGMLCQYVPAAFKMRSIQFISCSATAYGGGLYFRPEKTEMPDDQIYCYFLFFHECKCRTTSIPYGHDVEYVDYYNVYLNSGNPFFECYTTNTDEQRMCYAYNYSNANTWYFQHTEKWNWLKRGILNRFVAVSGGGEEELCGLDESSACRTIGVAVEKSVIQVSLSVTLMEGNHTSETTTINIETKKISVIGRGKDKSLIGTGALSAAEALFSVSTGHLGLLHMKVDCNSNANPSSPSVVVVSDGGGSLSLEDVVITTSVSSGEYVMSSSVFVVPLSQLSMVGVEITDMNVSKSLFSEPDLSSPSSSSLSSLSFSLTSSSSSSSSTSLSSSPPPALFSTLLPFLLRKQFHQR
ncbi:uncharacterized protein MONOS_14212 [Monocercomonoides exilis]|uniref:uncharacterized protein n=1 Tax=Monocercomonoides exilis TaxID=2049356 RepID=UPI00355AB249|nr:hypothetical protein MONOS_14212 [Monocercomonoides exilis]|eukprot:MONOS_14212.1-p1 / transcript=MONOS_14212.1 / gene=MONOS_14212 / organism=Monocercomonoides_exilis_PA203 / gene_product=unspecified product / transcript_product=unspecified product / location=Mono_scaffold00957:1917-3632(+) / protein_length=572 / sequence_SO=supercontig / SO=protein_coding / is_pseudo=false